jgi:dTDP-4-dehydrorhamnose 3,5-epimerase
MPSNELLPSWAVAGAVKDAQTINASWGATDQPLIHGVSIHEIRSVPKRGGYLTEILRSEWLGDNRKIDQVFQSVLEPQSITAWHAHARTTDRLFVSYGMARIVLFDARPDSVTWGMVNEFRIGTVRPALITIPPRIWHGVHAIAAGPTILLNIVDAAYDYTDPDHWRVPYDSPEIPFRF